MSGHESKAEAQRKRQQTEQMLVGASLMFIMDEIPGLGEIGMAGQILDYVDPYGYNHSLNREAIDKVMGKGIKTTLAMKEAMASYIIGGEGALTAAQAKLLKISSNPGLQKIKAQYDKLTSAKSKQSMINGILSVGNVVDPSAAFGEQLSPCIMAYDDVSMTKQCTDPEVAGYKDAYIKFWNENKEAYEANATKAAGKSFSGLVGPGALNKLAEQTNDVNSSKAKVAGLLTAIALVSIGMIVYVIFFSGGQGNVGIVNAAKST